MPCEQVEAWFARRSDRGDFRISHGGDPVVSPRLKRDRQAASTCSWKGIFGASSALVLFQLWARLKFGLNAVLGNHDFLPTEGRVVRIELKEYFFRMFSPMFASQLL